MRKVIRLRDIAQEAGVHEATVSAVLSESTLSGTRVSTATAKRIRRIAKEWNYRPNRHAQIIRHRRSGIIGIVEFGFSEIAVTRSYYVAKYFHEQGVEFLSQNTKWFNESVSEAIYHLLATQVEGVLLVMPNRTIPPDVLRKLKQQAVPMISYNGASFEGCPHVRSHVEQSMGDMVRHLVGLGHRDLALLVRGSSASMNNSRNWMIQERISGFELTIAQLGGIMLPNSEHPGGDMLTGRIHTTGVDALADNYYEDGIHAAENVLRWVRRPEALICSNDQFAIGVMQACKKRGVRVPEEIAVVGFGNLEVTPYLEIPMTTVDTRPQPDDGRVLLELMRKMIDGKPLMSEEYLIRTPSPLIIRESCGTGRRITKKGRR